MPDLQFSNLGFAAFCAPMTTAGRRWLKKNVAAESTAIGNTLLIEHRYLADIVEGARADGLVCEG